MENSASSMRHSVLQCPRLLQSVKTNIAGLASICLWIMSLCFDKPIDQVHVKLSLVLRPRSQLDGVAIVHPKELPGQRLEHVNEMRHSRRFLAVIFDTIELADLSGYMVTQLALSCLENRAKCSCLARPRGLTPMQGCTMMACLHIPSRL